MSGVQFPLSFPSMFHLHDEICLRTRSNKIASNECISNWTDFVFTQKVMRLFSLSRTKPCASSTKIAQRSSTLTVQCTMYILHTVLLYSANYVPDVQYKNLQSWTVTPRINRQYAFYHFNSSLPGRKNSSPLSRIINEKRVKLFFCCFCFCWGNSVDVANYSFCFIIILHIKS